jgi:hypothetical protein
MVDRACARAPDQLMAVEPPTLAATAATEPMDSAEQLEQQVFDQVSISWIIFGLCTYTSSDIFLVLQKTAKCHSKTADTTLSDHFEQNLWIACHS